MSMPILFCAPDGACATHLIRALAQDLEVVHFTGVAEVSACCRDQLPVAVVLPLPWSPKHATDAGADTPALEFLRAFGRRTTTLVYGSRITADAGRAALAAGAVRVLAADAPGFAAELARLLAEVVHDYRQRLEEQQALALLFSEYGLVGPSTDMQEVFRRALKASHFRDLPAVIVGGSGTPRGRLAVAIHNFDPQRNRRPFFSLDCTDLAKVLVDSAKREPDRASRTALSGWCGLFRAADGGTLFLDRVSELAPELQTALLGWSRSGRPAPDAADVVRGVRILAGDERPLDEAAAAGRLLPALATWLGLFRIELPALRGHPEDVAAQARRALRTYQTGRERVVLDFHPEALALLQRLLWAGNTRQLERTVRDALAHKERGTLLRLAELPAWVHEAPRDLPPARDGSDDAPARAEVPYQEWKLEEFERRLLRSVAGRFLSDSSPARERQPPR